MNKANSKTHEISDVDSKEFEELTSIWESSVMATHHFPSEEETSFFGPLIFSLYLHNLELYCIKINSVIVGFIGIDGKNIEMLIVAPQFRGTGIGKSLLLHATANQCTRVDVNEQNSQAITFYTNNGFSVIGRSETDGSGKPNPLIHMEYKPDKRFKGKI